MKTLITVAVLVAVLLGGCGEEGGWMVGFLPTIQNNQITLTPVKVKVEKNLDGVENYTSVASDISEADVQTAQARAEAAFKEVTGIFELGGNMEKVLSTYVYILLDDSSFTYRGYSDWGAAGNIGYVIEDVDGSVLEICPSASCKHSAFLASKVANSPAEDATTLSHELLHGLNRVLREADKKAFVDMIENLWQVTGAADPLMDSVLGWTWIGRETVVQSNGTETSSPFDSWVMEMVGPVDYTEAKSVMKATEQARAIDSLFRTVGKLAFMFRNNKADYFTRYAGNNPGMDYLQLRRAFLEGEVLSLLGEKAMYSANYPSVLAGPYSQVCISEYLNVLFGPDLNLLFSGSDNFYLRAENLEAYIELIRRIVPEVLAKGLAQGIYGKL